MCNTRSKQRRKINSTAKQKVISEPVHVKGKMSTSTHADFRYVDGTGLEAMEPTQETPKENKFKRNLQLCYMTKFLNLKLQSQEAIKNNRNKAKVYLARA